MNAQEKVSCSDSRSTAEGPKPGYLLPVWESIWPIYRPSVAFWLITTMLDRSCCSEAEENLWEKLLLSSSASSRITDNYGTLVLVLPLAAFDILLPWSENVLLRCSWSYLSAPSLILWSDLNSSKMAFTVLAFRALNAFLNPRPIFFLMNILCW